MRGVAGFSLVEVLVALVVLEVGLLGVAGLVVLSGRILAEAVRAEGAAFAGEELADSLVAAGAAGEGERRFPDGRLRWQTLSAEGGGVPLLRVVASDAGGRPLLVLHAVSRDSEFPAW